MSSTQVAKLFGFDKRTINGWAQVGLLPCVRTEDGEYRFSGKQVVLFMLAYTRNRRRWSV